MKEWERSTEHRTRIDRATAQLGVDELEVLAVIAERMARGRAVYGEWHADTDQRNHRREAAEEGMDAAVYLAMEEVRARRGLR